VQYEVARVDRLFATEMANICPSAASAPAIRPLATIASSSEKPPWLRADLEMIRLHRLKRIELRVLQPARQSAIRVQRLDNLEILRTDGSAACNHRHRRDRVSARLLRF
jgi:hypothetical protein